MRWTALLVAGCVAPLTGCNLFQLAGHNLANEPVQYIDDAHLTKRVRVEARLVWAGVCQEHPETPCSADYAEGFVDGYADHLENGGPVRPPVVPPLRYRRSKYFTPDGQAAVREYVAGFQTGAETAAKSGRRDLLLVPVVLANPQPDPPLKINREPAKPAAGEPLPPPRLVPPPRAGAAVNPGEAAP